MQNFKCNACKKENLQDLINFGKHPISTHLIRNKNIKYKLYDHKYGYCSKCELVQQAKLISINKLRPNTAWYPNKEENKHHRNFINKIVSKRIINKGNKILFTSHYDNIYHDELYKRKFSLFFFLNKLNYFKNLHNSDRQDIIQKFLNPNNAKKILNDYGKFDVIFCSSVLDHCSNIKNFYNFFNILLKKEGILIVEVPDNSKSLEQGNVSLFWEEHRFYFNRNSLVNSAKLNNFNKKIIFKFKYPQENFLNAIFCKKNNSFVETKKKEKKILYNFNKKFLKYKEKSNMIMDYYRSNNFDIYIFGAGHNSIKFIFFYNLNKLIDKVIDDDPKKLNNLIPSTNIKITNSNILRKSNKNKILIINGASINNETKIFDNLKKKFTGNIIRFKSIYTSSNKFIFKNV